MIADLEHLWQLYLFFLYYSLSCQWSHLNSDLAGFVFYLFILMID